MLSTKLVFCLSSIALIASTCKPRIAKDAKTKDIISVDANSKASLTYIARDSENANALYIFHNECGTLKPTVKFQDLWHENLRASCKNNAIKMPLSDFEAKWDDQYLKLSQAIQLTRLDLAVRDWVLKDLMKTNATTNQGEAIPDKVNYSNPAATEAHSTWITAMESVLFESKNPGSQNRNDPLPDNIGGSNTSDSDQSSGTIDEGTYSKNLADSAGGQFYTLNFTLKPSPDFSALALKIDPNDNSSCFLAIDSAAIVGTNGQLHRLNKVVASSNYVYEIPSTLRQFSRYRIRFINASLRALDCKFSAKSTTANQESLSRRQLSKRDTVMRELMGEKHHRLAHYLWHSARNSYLQPGATNADRANIDSMGWKPPRPVIYRRDGSGFANIDYDATARSGAGEDFLYMHREMIHAVKKKLEANGLTMYPAWPELPKPDNREFPLESRENDLQSADGFARLLAQEENFSAKNIKNFKTLSELGTHIEFTIHNSMHTRWAAPNWATRPVFEDPIANIKNRNNWTWDRPDYDHLADPYSAHVNPTFWRLHGWVDQKITDWLTAKGLQLKADCRGESASTCVAWRSDIWTGPSHDQIFSNVGSSKIDDESLRKTRRLLAQNAFMHSLSQ
ncbi:MAG: hypothetical protein NT027_17415 [Proteobacteria bacterium]|nr:hypothetical protein [Pseudomonadota bacterium]